MNQPQSEQKPLGEKTEAELKRETRARLKRMDPATATAVVDEVLSKQVNSSLAGFVAFLRERSVVGLAVGFVFGSQVQAVVNKFIAGFVAPFFQLIGGTSLDSASFTLHFDGHSAQFLWGSVAYALLNFLVVVATVYATIRIFKLDRLDKKA